MEQEQLSCFIRGVFHNNFPGFSGFRFFRKLAAHENSTRHRESNNETYSIIHEFKQWVVSTLCYTFYYIIFVINPTFWSSPLRPPAVAAATAGHWNTLSDTPGKTLLPLPLSRVWFSRRAVSLLVAHLHDTYTEPSNMPFTYWRVGHCLRFPTHYSWYCPTASVLPLPSSYLIPASVLILCRPYHPAYLLLYPSSHLYATSMLLLSQYQHVSTAVSTAILVCRPCLIVFLLPLYLSILFSPDFFIYRRLHHHASLPPPSLLSYISSVSLLFLSL